MDNPSVVKRKSTLSLVPKRVYGSPGKTTGAHGWGIQGVEGWSLSRMLCWPVAIGLLSIAVMLLLIRLVSEMNPLAALGLFTWQLTIWYLVGFMQYVAK